jgi:integrase
MITPNKNSRTKNSYITFFNAEAEVVLKKYLDTRNHKYSTLFPATRTLNKIFTRIKKKTGINITPQVLREWFCCEMGRLGVPDRFVDAFCGRVSRSILARHYTDYSPDRLKRIYDQAGLRVFN